MEILKDLPYDSITGLGVNMACYLLTEFINKPRTFEKEIIASIKDTESYFKQKNVSISLINLQKVILEEQESLKDVIYENDKKKREELLSHLLIEDSEQKNSVNQNGINLFTVFEKFLLIFEHNLLTNKKYNLEVIKNNLDAGIRNNTIKTEYLISLCEELGAGNYFTRLKPEYLKLKWDKSIDLFKHKIESHICLNEFDYYIDVGLISRFNEYISRIKWLDELKEEINNLKLLSFNNENYKLLREFIHEINSIEMSEQPLLVLGNVHDVIKKYKLLEILNQVRNDLEEKEYDITTIENAYNNISNLAINKVFRNCFLVTGSFGSGKTKAIHHIIQSINNIFPILVNKETFQKTLLNTLTKEITLILGVAVPENVENVINIINKGSDYNIVIFIDDLEILAMYQEDFLPDLEAFVDRGSLIPNLFWHISIDTNYLNLVYDYRSFFDRVTYLEYNYSWLSLSERQIGGWLYLDYFNKRQVCGEQIIKHHIGSSFLPSINEHVLRYINSPLLANIFVKYKNSNSEKLSFENYFDFYEAFEEEIFLRRPNSSNKDIQITQKKVTELICRKIINESCLSFEYEKLANSVELNGESNHMHIDRLLSKNLITNKINAYIESGVKELKINISFYWQYKTIINSITTSEKISEKLKSSNDKDFINYLSELLENYLLAQSEDALKNVKIFINNDLIPNHAVYSSSIKQKKNIQEQIFNSLKEDYRLIKNKQDGIAFIRFVSEVDSESINIIQKVDLFNQVLDSFLEFNLVPQYLHELKKYILQIDTTDILIGFIRKTYDYHKLRISKELSFDIFQKIKYLFNYHIPSINKFIIHEVIFSPNSMNETDFMMRKKGDVKLSKIYMGEFYLNHLSNFINHEFGVRKAYSFYTNNGWYIDFNDGGKERVSILKKEVNLSLGRHFDKLGKEDQIDFINFLKELSLQKDKRILERCFYIIKHTIHDSKSESLQKEMKYILGHIGNICKNEYFLNSSFNKKFYLVNRIN